MLFFLSLKENPEELDEGLGYGFSIVGASGEEDS